MKHVIWGKNKGTILTESEVDERIKSAMPEFKTKIKAIQVRDDLDNKFTDIIFYQKTKTKNNDPKLFIQENDPKKRLKTEVVKQILDILEFDISIRLKKQSNYDEYESWEDENSNNIPKTTKWFFGKDYDFVDEEKILRMIK